MLTLLCLTGCNSYKFVLPFHKPDRSNNNYFSPGVRRAPKYNTYYLNQIADGDQKKLAQEQEEDTWAAAPPTRDIVAAEGEAISHDTAEQEAKHAYFKRRGVTANLTNNAPEPVTLTHSVTAPQAPPVIPVRGQQTVPASPIAATTAQAPLPTAPSDIAGDPDLSVLDMGLTETR